VKALKRLWNWAEAAQPEESTRVELPGTNDPLSDALIYIAAHHGRPISRDALIAGLPVEGHRLEPKLLARAAKRAGLEVEIVKRKLSDIPSLVLPVILLMNDGSARIYLRSDPKTNRPVITDPSDPDRAARTKEPEYSGYACFVRPMAATDSRATMAVGPMQDHWFWAVVVQFWNNYSHVAIAALIVNILALAAPLFIMNVYDRVIPNGAIPSLIALAIGLIIAIVFDFVLRIVRSRIIDMTGKQIDVVLASNIFEHVISVKMAKRPGSVGVIANQLRDFESVREFFTSGTVVSITDLAFAIVFLAVLYMIAGPLAFIPAIMLPVMLGIGLLLQKPLDQAMKRLQGESAARHGVLVEALSGIETVRAVSAEARMQSKWERSIAATARSGEDVHFWSSLALTFASTATQVTTLIMVVWGVFLIMDGQITMGALIAASMLGGRVMAPIAGIAAVITRATQTLSALKAIDGIMALERERPPSRSYVTRKITEGRVAFDNVTFKYPGAPDNALDHISFKIEPGERVGIIGRVGSGKTTVGRLLAGFYEPENGRIMIDGIDARQYDPADLRRGVGFVLQDVDLFYGKLRENITLGKPSASDEEVIEAARLAGVESFIAGNPLGYEMPIAEQGRSLSGGQKQAIGLARVLIRKPKILFLDEPTAHFDIRSENEFLQRLKTLAAGDMSIIVSTHRLSLLALVERLMFFDRGRLLLDGPRDAVLAKLRDFTGQAAKAPDGAAKPAPARAAAPAPVSSPPIAEKKSSAAV
jgi:ATP-binding cassette, subfamily C, bacterial LapB